MTQLLPPTLDELIACAEREVRFRQHVYPRRVAKRQMTQEKADRELELMEEIARRLHELREPARDQQAPEQP